MSWKNPSEDADMRVAILDPLAEIRSFLIEEYGERRHRVGAKTALHDLAEDLGITFRRIRGFVYGEARGISAQEYLQIRERREQMLRLRLRRLDHEADILRRRLDECS